MTEGHDSSEPTGPLIGADEWVARSGERIQAYRGVLGGARRQAERIPMPAVALAFGGACALIPVLTSNQYIIRVGVDTLVYALLALGLNVAVGFAGLLDLGYIAFYGFGAYGYSMLSSSKFGVHWPTWGSIPVVVVATILLGFVLALPSRRLVGDYLAIVTLFFGQIFYTITTQGYRVPGLGDVTGGPNGIPDVDGFRAFGHRLTSNEAYFYVALIAVVVVFIALHLANRSRTGRGWRSLRDDALAAEVMSMPVSWLKLLAVAVGAGAAGLAGTIHGAVLHLAAPDDYNTQALIIIYAIVVLGGAGSLAGVVLGAIVIDVTLEVLRTPTHARWIFYVAILAALVLKLRPWRALAALLAATAAFGVVLNQIVGAVWERGIHGLIYQGGITFTNGGWLGGALRHWLVLPANTYEVEKFTIGNLALALLIAFILSLTLVRGLARYALLVPTLWLAAFAWENRLVEEGVGPTRFLLLGSILIVLMAARPQGLLGTPRVEIV